MSIDPYVLLGVGSFFALLYAAVIVFGWARTRRNRRIIQGDEAISFVPTKILDETITNAPDCVRTFSLKNNIFLDSAGNKIDVEAYDCYIAVGESTEYPGVSNGDLMLIDKQGSVKHVFTLPCLKVEG